jgi:hypothetical protein
MTTASGSRMTAVMADNLVILSDLGEVRAHSRNLIDAGLNWSSLEALRLRGLAALVPVPGETIHKIKITVDGMRAAEAIKRERALPDHADVPPTGHKSPFLAPSRSLDVLHAQWKAAVARYQNTGAMADWEIAVDAQSRHGYLQRLAERHPVQHSEQGARRHTFYTTLTGLICLDLCGTLWSFEAFYNGRSLGFGQVRTDDVAADPIHAMRQAAEAVLADLAMPDRTARESFIALCVMP